jgi:hypothetical protein
MTEPELSDSEAEAMDRARTPSWWKVSDEWLAKHADLPMGQENIRTVELHVRSDHLTAIRRAFAARPERFHLKGGAE